MGLADLAPPVAIVVLGLIGLAIGIKYRDKFRGSGIFREFSQGIPSIIVPASPEPLPTPDPKFALSLKEALAAAIAEKHKFCTEMHHSCDTCERKDVYAPSKCSYDARFLTLIEQRAMTEQDAWAEFMHQVQTLNQNFEWAKSTLYPELDRANKNFGEVTWRNKLFLGFLTFNSGTLIGGFWWLITTVLGML